jgi:PRTRC genetic system protein B
MIEKIRERYEPLNVLVVYKNKVTDDNYIEIHSIKKGKVMEGVPLKNKTLHELLLFTGKDSQQQLSFRGLIPENILYYNCNSITPKLVWFEAAIIRNINFKGTGGGVVSGEAVVPSIIFCYEDDQLSVYATKYSSVKEVHENEVLYHLPLPNIHEDCSVCMGTVNMQFKDEVEFVDDIMEVCSERFWDSTFTTFHNEEPLKGRNIYEFWVKQVKEKLSFPREVLLETKIKVKDLCKK